MNFTDVQPVDKTTAKAIAKYMLLPGIWPRLKNLGALASRFLFIFVQILGVAGLIDPAHPCLKPENIGRYGLTDIMLHAWGNVKFDRQNMSQAIMFFAVAAAILLSAAIVISSLVLLALNLGGTAHAQYFSTPTGTGIPYDPSNDWAFQFLERIFGGHEQTGLDFWIHNDNVKGGNPWFSAILVGMLSVYAKALLFIAGIMILYLISITLVDAARSGQPFGTKFDSVWAPIRFALAIGLLIPVSGGGYNGAQMLAFQAAELGSNLATNVWHRGIRQMNGERGAQQYMSASVTDPGYRLLRDLFLINLCVYGYNTLMEKGQITNATVKISADPTVTTVGDTTVFSYGIKDSDEASDFCGSVTLQHLPAMPASYQHDTRVDGTKMDEDDPIEREIIRNQNNYMPRTLINHYNTTARSFMPPTSQMKPVAEMLIRTALVDKDKSFIEAQCNGAPCARQVEKWVYGYWEKALGRNPAVAAQNHFLAGYERDMNAYNRWVSQAVTQDAAFGWASAGVFYMRMSNALSVLSQSTKAQAQVTKLPANFSMNYATPLEPTLDDEKAQAKCGMTPDDPACDRYKGSALLANIIQKGEAFFTGAPKASINTNDLNFYRLVNGRNWEADLRMREKEPLGATDISQVLGPLQTELYSVFRISEDGLHPLGQVVQWGNMFMTLADKSYALSIGMGVIGQILPGTLGGGFATTLSNIAYFIGTIFIVPGFVLMFIVPMLPFMYFTFAVIEWAASIVEAVIGLPLWALSFITLRGDLGTPAMQGGKLLFEIVLRPTIIVMSLVGSILIFTAVIGFFNNSIQLYMGAYGTNADYSLNYGSDIAGGLGMIFVYAFGIYLLATSCFKLIDAIPNRFTRWFSQDMTGFGAYTRMGVFGAGETLGAAYIAKQTAGLGRKALSVPADALGRQAKILREAEQHEKWLYKGYVTKGGVKVASAVEQTNEYNRTATRNNEAATEFNSRLDEINADREKKGQRALPPMGFMKYQKMPQKEDYNYYAKTIDADKMTRLSRGEVGFNSGDFYSTPPAAPPSSNNNAGGGSGPNAPGPGNSQGPANPPPAQNDVSQQNLLDFYNKLNSGAPITGRLSKLTGKSGKLYSINDLKKAFSVMKLPPNASRQQIKQQYNTLKNTFNPSTLNKNKDFRKLTFAYKALNDAFDLDY